MLKNLKALLIFIVGIAVFGALAVVAVPAIVDGVAYLTGQESTSTFTAVANTEHCSPHGGCKTYTTGHFTDGTAITLTRTVPPGTRIRMAEPPMTWGLGSDEIGSVWSALGATFVGLLAETLSLGLFAIFGWVLFGGRRRRRKRQPEVAADRQEAA